MTYFIKLTGSLFFCAFLFSCGGGDEFSFSAPDVQFATYEEVDAYTDSLAARRSDLFDEIHPNKGDEYKDELQAKYVAAAAGQTCDCLASFDLDYAEQDDYEKWASIAQLNYDLGVETETDSKVIAYNQLLNVYGNLANNGSVIRLERGNNNRSLAAFSMLYAEGYNAEVEKQCGELRKQIMKVHDDKYSDHDLLEYLRNR